MFRNMKIRGKLGLGFAMLLVIVGVIAFFGIFFIVQITQDTRYAQNYPLERHDTLNDMATEIMNARRMVVMMAFNAGNEAELNQVSNDFAEMRARVSYLLNAYSQSFQVDPRIEGERRDEAIYFAAELERRIIMLYIYDVAYPMLEIAMHDSHNQAEILRLLGEGVEVHGRIESLFNALMEAAQDTVEEINTQVDYLTNTAITVMIILSVVGLIVGVLVAMLISGSISKPIREVADILDNVSNGDFNVNIKSNLGRDEIGIMTRDAYRLVDVIKSLVDDLEKFSYENSVVGDIDYRIDASKYQGGYKQMIKSLNDFTDDFTKGVIDLLSMLMNINKGNFHTELRKQPGKKYIMNETADALMANLDAVSVEVNEMIKSAVNGNLSARIDESKFEGDWRSLMAGLNQVKEAVNEPILEISDVMSRLSKGDFATKVTGNYQGDFLSMSETVNSTITALSSYVSEIGDCLDAVSDGHLTRSLSTDIVFHGDFERISRSIENIITTLQKTMTEITSASEQVLMGARQISTSASDLAAGASTQASSVQQLNASVDLINHQTRQNADNAGNANSLANSSTTNAQSGNEAMSQLMEAMSQIRESSNSISQIIKTIQDIAFQTNLLSLNASVEAARAGEHGKGFGVVADEVRLLASRSQDAVRETEEMIATAISRIEVGVGIANTTSESLNNIVSSATDVLAIINNIADASRDQAEAIEQVSTGLQQISGVVQNNSAVSEETAAASEELNSQAEFLQQLVAYFKL